MDLDGRWIFKEGRESSVESRCDPPLSRVAASRIESRRKEMKWQPRNKQMQDEAKKGKEERMSLKRGSNFGMRLKVILPASESEFCLISPRMKSEQLVINMFTLFLRRGMTGILGVFRAFKTRWLISKATFISSPSFTLFSVSFSRQPGVSIRVVPHPKLRFVYFKFTSARKWRRRRLVTPAQLLTWSKKQKNVSRSLLFEIDDDATRPCYESNDSRYLILRVTRR